MHTLIINIGTNEPEKPLSLLIWHLTSKIAWSLMLLVNQKSQLKLTIKQAHSGKCTPHSLETQWVFSGCCGAQDHSHAVCSSDRAESQTFLHLQCERIYSPGYMRSLQSLQCNQSQHSYMHFKIRCSIFIQSTVTSNQVQRNLWSVISDIINWSILSVWWPHMVTRCVSIP